jgi:hypothetical protein
MGIPFFKPIWQKDTRLQIYPLANEVQQAAGRTRALFDGIHFPVRAADVPGTIEFIETEPSPFRIGSASIRRIALNHPGGAQGFRIDDDGGASLAYLTDNELSPLGPPTTSLDALAKFAEGANLVIHDAQYVESEMPAKRGWGHSTIEDVLRLGQKARSMASSSAPGSGSRRTRRGRWRRRRARGSCSISGSPSRPRRPRGRRTKSAARSPR